MSRARTLSDHAHEWFEKVWNERDESAIDRMLNAKTQIDGIGVKDATSLSGPEEFKVFHRAFLSGLPDLKVTITKTVEEGDWVCVRFVCDATHTGPGLGMPPTGRKVSFSSIAMGRVENGQWVEGWNLVDFISLNQQIGGALRLSGD